MAPILIDNRGLIKLGLVSVLTAVIVFAAGFLSGYQQATTFYATGSKVETLSLPVKPALLEIDIQQQAPDTVVAGKEIDVDQPQRELNADLKAVNAAGDPPVKVNVSTSKANKNDSPSAGKQTSVVQLTKLDNEYIGEDVAISNDSNKLSIKEKVASKNNQPRPAELSNIKYSIQVGMYGRLINAENMMTMLQAQQLDAYVSDYINSKNKKLYNVRFGYFVDKKSALAALKEYRNKQKADGYLVNFSIENITNLADARNIKPRNIKKSATKKIEKKVLPEAIPSEATPSEAMSTGNGQDKVS